jgi:hypothetical protein
MENNFDNRTETDSQPPIQSLREKYNRPSDGRKDAPAAGPSTGENTRGEFSEAPQPCQLRLPADLIQSLRLLAFQSGESMSEIALRCLTSGEVVPKCWVNVRGGKKSA